MEDRWIALLSARLDAAEEQPFKSSNEEKVAWLRQNKWWWLWLDDAYREAAEAIIQEEQHSDGPFQETTETLAERFRVAWEYWNRCASINHELSIRALPDQTTYPKVPWPKLSRQHRMKLAAKFPTRHSQKPHPWLIQPIQDKPIREKKDGGIVTTYVPQVPEHFFVDEPNWSGPWVMTVNLNARDSEITAQFKSFLENQRKLRRVPDPPQHKYHMPGFADFKLLAEHGIEAPVPVSPRFLTSFAAVEAWDNRDAGIVLTENERSQLNSAIRKLKFDS